MRAGLAALIAIVALSSGASRGTVAGTIDAGPTCPVERVGHPCPPRPVNATVQARDPHGRLGSSTRSDAHGRFTLKLPAGTFRLRVLTHVFPRCPVVTVRVRARQTVHAAVHCDTGIR